MTQGRFHLTTIDCSLSRQKIDRGCLKYQGQSHHPYHFQCVSCRSVLINCFMRDKSLFFNDRSELDENCREVRGALYCSGCHHQLDLPVCAACRRVIDDRVISALGKQWHVEVRRHSCRSDKIDLSLIAFLLCTLCSTISRK